MTNGFFYYHFSKRIIVMVLPGKLVSPSSSSLPGLLSITVFSAQELFTVTLMEVVLTVFEKTS